VPRLLADVEASWPLRGDDDRRGLLGQFLALHVIRTDAAKRWFAEAREESLAGVQEGWDQGLPFHQFAGHIRSDKERALKLMALINKLASGFASMHWTLLRFDEPMLLTCDQPVCPVPLLDEGERHEVDPTPARGWINTIEVRFPLSPQLGLLASWYPGPERDQPLRGSWAQAVNLNGALRAQASRQWFHDPRRIPPLPPAIFRETDLDFQPITPEVVPGYSTPAARKSPLRLGVLKEIETLIERQDDNAMFIARPRFARAA
jgi:uncharacterized protein DUF4238